MTEDEIRDIYDRAETIAVVGASADESKDAHEIPRYLQEQGFRIIPVNPTADEVFGEIAFDTLADVETPIDVVNVFRPAEEAPGIAREAVEVGAKVLWLQLGIESAEAREIAEQAGLTVLMDRCIGATHRELHGS